MNNNINYLVFLIVNFVLLSNYGYLIKQYDVVGNSITNSSNIVKNTVLNNSFQLQYTVINRGNSFRDSMVRDYFILNIDRDSYPDLLIWYPGKLIVWSFNRGVYSTYYSNSPNRYITKPIPIDYNRDNIVDYVLVFESTYMDAAILSSSSYVNSFTTYVYRWEPLGRSRLLSILRGSYIDSSTYYIYGEYLFLPTTINYYDNHLNNTRTYCSKIGLLRVHIVSNNINSYLVRTFCNNVPETSKPTANDYTTNYEIYIVGSGDTLYLIPMGLDRVIRVRYVVDSIVFDREYTVGPSQWNDNIMVIGRSYPAIPFGAWATNIYTYWRSPQRLDVKLINNNLVIATADFCWLNPTDSENGVYFRVERVRGIGLLSIQTNQYREIVLLIRQTQISGRIYTIRVITSIVIDTNSSVIYYSGLASDSNGNHVVFVNTYNYVTNEDRNVWFREINQYMAKTSFQVTINIHNSRRIYATLYAMRVDSDSRDALFHAFQVYRTPKYTLYPPSTIKPVVLNIDNDSFEEYLFIMQYANYTPYYYYPGDIVGMYPLVHSGLNYLVWFKKPVLSTNITCSDETCYDTTLEHVFLSTKYSSNLVEVIDSRGNTIYSKNVSANTLLRERIIFRNPGIYRYNILTKTVYHVDEWIDGRGVFSQVINYEERLNNYISINVRYKTRILLSKPYLEKMTPNHYSNGLQVSFILEYLNFNDNKWYRLPGQSVYLRVFLINDTKTIAKTPSDNRNGLYSCVFDNIVPSRYLIQVNYTGSDNYLHVSLTKYIDLIPYPVSININYSNRTPALTLLRMYTVLKYRYIDNNGNWFENILTTGRALELQVFNNCGSLVYRNNYSIVESVYIPREYVLPGDYCFTLRYIPSSVYYGQAVSYGYYSVYPLKLWVDIVDLLDNTSITREPFVIHGSKILVEIREYISDTEYRELSANMCIDFNRDNKTAYNVVTKNTYTTIDTSNIKPSYYRVTVYPCEFSMAYFPKQHVFDIYITEALGYVIGKLEPLIEVNTTNELEKMRNCVATYTLIPVKLYINTSIYPEELLSKAVVKVIIDNETYIVSNISQPLVFIPLKPGYKEVVLVVETEFLKLINYTYLTVYPHPVRIVVEKGSIVIKTIDLLNRSAPGLINVEIRDSRRKLLLKNTFETNGSVALSIPADSEWIYVYVEFIGNESYSKTYLLKHIYIGSRDYLKVVNEPLFLNLLVLTVLLTYLVGKKRIGISNELQ